MKKYLILIAIIALVSCEKKEKDIVVHDIMIRGKEALAVNRNSNSVHLSAKEIAKQATYIAYRVQSFGWDIGKNFVFDYQRDTVKGIIQRHASDILDPSNYALDSTFITGKGMVVERYYNGWTEKNGIKWPYIDTIAYIPDTVLINAYNIIIPAFKAKDYQKIYDVFNEKFVFIPITGAEYRALINK